MGVYILVVPGAACAMRKASVQSPSYRILIPKACKETSPEGHEAQTGVSSRTRSGTQPSPMACFSPRVPLSSPFSPVEQPARDAHALTYQRVNAWYRSHDGSSTARATSRPPARSCRPAARSTGAHSPAARWVGVKRPSPPLRSLPATCFTDTPQRSGCSSRAGWCLTPNPLKLAEIASLTLEALGQANNSNNSTEIFPWAHRAAAPVSSRLWPHTRAGEGVLAFCPCENTPACTHEVFPPLPTKGSSKYLYYHHSLP